MPSPTTAPSVPSETAVTIGDAQFQAEVASTEVQRSQGLSGRPGLAPRSGMLLVFDEPGLHSIDTIGMQFNLDFVWIGADCTVVHRTQGVPPPQPGQEQTYQPNTPARYALLINAEEVFDTGVQDGDAVSFAPPLGGSDSC